MIVVSLVNPPNFLRGDLSKWLQEINTNVYVGNVNARVRDALWDRITDSIKTGQATMVFTTNNEQGMDFRVWGTTWQPTEFDGLILVKRPFPKKLDTPVPNSEIPSTITRKHKYFRTPNLNPLPSDDELLAFIDIETTGLDDKRDQIIEIGIVIANMDEVIEKKNYLINTDSRISQEIEKLTGITNDLLKREGGSLENALYELTKLIGNKIVVFHNSRFDLKFLMKAYKDINQKPPLWEIRDTLRISKKKLPHLKNYQLQSVSKELDCCFLPTHRAIEDCLATWEVYVKLMNL